MSRTGSAIALAAAVALILVLAGPRAVGSNDARSVAVPTAPSPTTTSTTTTSFTTTTPAPIPTTSAAPAAPSPTPTGGPAGLVEPLGPVGCPAGERPEFCLMVAFVERETGRAFRSFPVIELAADEEFEARLLADLHESRDDIDDQGHLLTALGLLAPGDDLYTSMRDLLGVGVVGFYAAKTDELVVRGETVTAYVAETLTHELVHALDDQWYGLYRPAYEDRSDEVAFGFAAVVEGHALRVQDRWREAQPAEVRLDASSEQLAYVSDIDVSRFPAMALRLISAPYLHGPDFLAVLDDRGFDLAGAFADPPVSSEQVLHPLRYLDAERPVTLEAPPADGVEVDDGTIGEFLLKQVLTVHLGDERRAARAADGWAGDRYRTWKADDGARCVRIDLEADTDRDHRELVAAFQAVAAGDPGWAVDDRGASLWVTACR